MVVVNEALTFLNDFATVEKETDELSVFFVEDCLNLVVTKVHLTVLVNTIFKRSLTLDCSKCGTCHEFVLLERYFMPCRSKDLFCSVANTEVQEDFFTLLFCFG